MYAVISTGGKQQKVTVGDTIYIEKLDEKDGAKVDFEVLLFADEDKVKIGTPIVKDVKVTGKVIRQVRGKKVIVFKYKPKKNIRKKNGHRQPHTAVEITSIKKVEKKATVAKTDSKAEATPAKKATVKKTETKAVKKPVAKTTTAKKPVAKTTTAKKPAAKKPAAKKPAAKKPAAKKPAAKKPAAKPVKEA